MTIMNKKIVKKMILYLFTIVFVCSVLYVFEDVIYQYALSTYSFLYARVFLYYTLLFIGGLIYYMYTPISRINIYIAVPFYIFTVFVGEFLLGFISARLTARLFYFLIVTTLPLVIFKKQRDFSPKLLIEATILYIIASIVPLILRMEIPTQYYNYCECWMDMAIFTNSMRVEKLPLEDPWLSGFPMIYYYGGHYGLATLTLITMIPPKYGINIASATVLQLLFLAFYGISLVFMEKRKVPQAKILSVIIATALTFGANIYPFLEYVQYLRTGNEQFFNAATWHLSPAYLIPGTTHHVPMVDFYQKELHANYIMTPFLVTYIWLVYALRSEERNPLILSVYNGFFIPMFIWSWPVVSLYTFLFMMNHYGLIIPILGALIYAPYVLTLLKGEGISGITFISPSNAVIPRTPVSAIVLYLLPFLIALYGHIFVKILKKEKNSLVRVLIATAIAVPFIFTRYRAMTVLVGPLVYMMLDRSEERALRSLIFTGMITIIACDFVYVNDIFGGYWERFNTVFKFYETAWVLLSASIPLLIARSWLITPKRRSLLRVWYGIKWALMFSLVLSLTYAPLGYYGSKYEYWDSFDADKFTLDGSEILEIHDKIIVNTLLRMPRGVIVELPPVDGKSYEYNGRISAFSGDPTIIGWPSHEYVWRGQKGFNIGWSRSLDIFNFYKNPCNDTLNKLIEKYNVKYIVFSKLEAEYVLQNNASLTLYEWRQKLLSTSRVKPIIEIGPYGLYEIISKE
ncbi:MAG: hypothetical protein DRN30_02405 [Thermoplasmata archaeon]|nr:MAG: hypothetical protein DRN30_02405 [Thermoplasmata archaeon]